MKRSIWDTDPYESARRWPLSTPLVSQKHTATEDAVQSLADVAFRAVTLALDHADAHPGAVPARLVLGLRRAFEALATDAEG